MAVSAGPTLTLPIVLVTTERPIHIHTVLNGNEVRVSYVYRLPPVSFYRVRIRNLFSSVSWSSAGA